MFPVRLSATPGYGRMPYTPAAACKRGAESSPSCGLSELCGHAELPALHQPADAALRPGSAPAVCRHHCFRGTAAYSRKRAGCLVPWKYWTPLHWQCRCAERRTRRIRTAEKKLHIAVAENFLPLVLWVAVLQSGKILEHAGHRDIAGANDADAPG